MTPLEVGAAIERGGVHVDAIQFYEDILKRAPSGSIRTKAAERLVKCHERYAGFIRIEQKQEKTADNRLREAERVREEWKVTNESIPEYPVVAEEAVPDLPVIRVEGAFKILVSKLHARVRIEHRDRFETVTVDGKEKRLLGDAKFTQLAPAGTEAAAWEVEGWDCVVRLFVGESDLRVVVQAGEAQVCDVRLA